MLQSVAAKEHAIGACAFVPCKVSHIVLRCVKVTNFWKSKYQSFLPGSPAAVPLIKTMLASAAFRKVCYGDHRCIQSKTTNIPTMSVHMTFKLQNVNEEEVEVVRVLLALACAAKSVRDRQADVAFRKYDNRKKIKAEAASSVTKWVFCMNAGTCRWLVDAP